MAVNKLDPYRAHVLATLARVLVSAARTAALYPPEHPGVAAAIKRISPVFVTAIEANISSISVTPDSLLAGDQAIETPDEMVREAAAILHGHAILSISFERRVPPVAWQRLVLMLAQEPGLLRDKGGPALVWQREGHPSIRIRQIEYRGLVKDGGPMKATRRRDDVWRSIVSSMAAGTMLTDVIEQERLLEIAADADDAAELCRMVAAECSRNGAGVSEQAESVLRTLSQLAAATIARNPAGYETAIDNLASAISKIDSAIVVHLLASQTSSGRAEFPILEEITAALDDERAAKVLAAIIEGQGASERLADVVRSLVPDEGRLGAVVERTRSRLEESAFGRTSDFASVWNSVESLLALKTATASVPGDYRRQLDGARARAAADGPLPSEMPAWLASVEPQSVGRQSAILLKDLFALELDADHRLSLLPELATAAEDLLEKQDYEIARVVIDVIAGARNSHESRVSAAALAFLETVGRSTQLRQALSRLSLADPATFDVLQRIVATVGISAGESLRDRLINETDATSRSRLCAMLAILGADVLDLLATLMSSVPASTTLAAIDLLAGIGTAEAVSVLQPLVASGDTVVRRAAVHALSRINTQDAERAVVAAVLRGNKAQRTAVVEAIAADGSPAGNVLYAVIEECDPLGRDYEIVLHVLAALRNRRLAGGERGLSALTRLMAVRRRLAPRRTREVRRRAVEMLMQSDSEPAVEVLAEARQNGDRLLRRIIERTGRA